MDLGGVRVDFIYDGATWQLYIQAGVSGDALNADDIGVTVQPFDSGLLTVEEGATKTSRKNSIINGNFDINTNKFTVNATSGNTQVAGTFGSTGAITASAGLVGNVIGNVTGNVTSSGTSTSGV